MATKPEHPVIQSNDDNGSGFTLVIQDQFRHQTYLEAVGCQINTHDSHANRLSFTLRSKHEDFEGDSLYLLDAEFYGETTWIGPWVTFEGVLTRFLWRSEENVDEEINENPRKEATYIPKGPFGSRNRSSNDPIQALVVYISAYPRGLLAATA